MMRLYAAQNISVKVATLTQRAEMPDTIRHDTGYQ